jgi:hypothetical protein
MSKYAVTLHDQSIAVVNKARQAAGREFYGYNRRFSQAVEMQGWEILPVSSNLQLHKKDPVWAPPPHTSDTEGSYPHPSLIVPRDWKLSKNDLKFFKTTQLGTLSHLKILAYHKSRNTKHLDDLFLLLNEMARRIIYLDYRRVQHHVKDDTIAEVSEDVLILISKYPENHINHDSFFRYFRRAIRNRASSTLQRLYKFTETFEYLEDLDGTGQAQLESMSDKFPLAYDLIIRRDNVKILVNTITRILKYHPTLSHRWGYFLWPVLYSILYDNNEVFSRMNFRDRCSLRIVRSQGLEIFKVRMAEYDR